MKPLYQAIKQTHQTTGKAIMMTTLILVAGFLILASSNFTGTSNIGIFTALCLVLALLADLILLPILIYLCYKPIIA